MFNRGGIVFPNMHYNTGGRTTIGVWVPYATGETEVWRWLFVPKDAPQIVKDTLRHFYLRYGGPGGMTEQDDMENWTAAQRATTGTVAKRFPFVYRLNSEPAKMGWPEPWIGERSMVVEDITEHNQRSFYRRWSELMEGEA
jgi:hypothetical protein